MLYKTFCSLLHFTTKSNSYLPPVSSAKEFAASTSKQATKSYLINLIIMESHKPVDQLRNDDRPWTKTIFVLDKYSPYQSPTKPSKLQRFVFTDDTGAKVEGIMFNKACDTMSHRLQLYKKYKITNADIREIAADYQKDDLYVQWIINNSTVIEEVNEPTQLISVPREYVPFDKVIDYLDKPNEEIDVIGIVAACHPERTVKAKRGPKKLLKFVLVDDKLQTMILSMWEEFIPIEGKYLIDNLRSFPVLIGRRLGVDWFNGLELSTLFKTSLLIDATNEESTKLKTWAKENENEIAKAVAEMPHQNNPIAIPINENTHYTPVANILPDQKVATTKVSISFKDIGQKYYYMACNKCFHSTSASYKYEYKCNMCEGKQVAEPRCRLEARLSDESGDITATFFGAHAEKLLGITALEAMDGVSQQHIEDRHIAMENIRYLVQVKVPKTKECELVEKYLVLCVTEDNAAEGSASTLELTNKPSDHTSFDEDIPIAKSCITKQSPESNSAKKSRSAKVEPMTPSSMHAQTGTRSSTRTNLLSRYDIEDVGQSKSQGKKPKLG